MRPVAAVEGDLLQLEGDPVPQVVRLAQVLERQRADLRFSLMSRDYVEEFHQITN